MRVLYRYNGTILDQVNLETLDPDNIIFYDLSLADKALGSGTYGTVYPAKITCCFAEQTLPELVIKVQDYNGSPLSQIELHREAAFFNEVNGGPVRVSFDPTNKKSYLVMKRIAGRPLCDVLNDDSLSWLKKLELVDKVFSALHSKLHAEGIIHGDLNSANVMVTELEDGSFDIHFIDFGYLARKTTERAPRFHATRKSYYHPELFVRPGEEEAARRSSLPAKPAHDVFALCACLSYSGADNEPFKPFLCPLTKQKTHSIAAVRETLKVQLLKAQVAIVEQSLTDEEHLRFVQLILLSDKTQLRDFLRGKDPETFEHISVQALNIDWKDPYLQAYYDNLLAYCCADERVIETARADLAELRASLPEHIRLADEELLTAVQTAAKAKMTETVMTVLSSDEVSSFAITATALREKLKPSYQSLTDPELEEIIQEAISSNLKILKASLSNANSMTAFILFIYGPEHLRALLSTSECYKRVVPILDDEAFANYWQQIERLCPNTREALNRHLKLLELLEAKLDNGLALIKKFTSIDLKLLRGDLAIDELRIKLQTTKRQLLANLLRTTLDDFSANDSYGDVTAYWQTRINILEAREPAAELNEWLELQDYLQSSLTLVLDFDQEYKPFYEENGYAEIATHWQNRLQQLATREAPIATSEDWATLNVLINVSAITINCFHDCKSSYPEEVHATVNNYWFEQLMRFIRNPSTTTVDDWSQAHCQIDFSYLVMDGFSAYEAACQDAEKPINANYKTYALTQPERHNLGQICHLIATENQDCRKLSRESFLVYLLRHQPVDDLDNNKLLPLLETAEGLVECFEERLYLMEGDNSGPGLFDNPTGQAYRDRILQAVKDYAEHALTDEAELVTELAL